MASWFSNYIQYDNLLVFFVNHHIIFSFLLVSCKSHPPLWLITTNLPMMMTWHVICQQNDVVLFVNIMIYVIDLINSSHLLSSWKYWCFLQLIMIIFLHDEDMAWHLASRCHKFSWQSMIFLWHHKFLCLEFMAPIFVVTCHNFLCAMKFLKSWIHMHVYVY